MRPSERLVGSIEVAQPKADHAQLIEPLGGLSDIVAVEFLAGLADLDLRLGPGAPQLRDLRPANPAHAGEARNGLLVAPSFGGVVPLGGASQVREVEAGRDHVAEDNSGDEGVERPP